MFDVKFPAKYYEGNKVFAHDSTSWAYFEMEGYYYDFLTPEQKLRKSRKMKDFLASIGFDSHLLITAHFFSVDDIHEESKARLTGDLKKVAIDHFDAAAEQIKLINGEEANDYRYFLGVQLPKFDYEANDLKGIVEQIKDIKNHFFSFFNLDDLDVTQEEYERADIKSKRLHEIFKDSFSGIKPVDEAELTWLYKRNFFRSIVNTPLFKDYKINSETTEKGKKIHAPDLLRLSEGIVDTSKAGEVSITQMIEGEEKTGYTAFVTVSNIPTNQFGEIGNEWIYLSQSFNFPVDTSIRSSTIKQKEMQDKIRNTKKEIDSEYENAAQVNADVSNDVKESERIINDLDNSIKGTRSVTLKTSIVYAISAPDREELKSRVATFTNAYAEMDISISQPGSDQWLLFNEFLPGAKKYVNDYNRIIEPGMLASGMFGATKNIGDNRGFYIGNELSQGYNVYIDPSMAAKNLTKTKSRTLSADFLGPPGGGKSFAANLITYLSVLQGGMAFLVDPKNDRTYWEEKLVFIKDHVNVITLTGEDKNKGRLDPYSICSTLDRAQALAVNICTFLTQSTLQDESFTYISEAAEEVTKMEKPCMLELVNFLLNHKEDEAVKTGKRLKVFTRLSFAKLLFGDGSDVTPLNPKHKINVLQIANLSLPDESKLVKNYNFNEMLSMAMMFPIGEFAHEFMHNIPSHIFKIIFFDESWFMEKTSIGKEIINQLQREGRARNAGIYRATQAVNDTGEDSKSMVAMKFIFQNNDVEQCKNALKFLGLDHEDQTNVEMIQELDLGECLFQDIKGRTARIKIMHLFKDLEDAFDTTPPDQMIEQTEDSQEVVNV